MNKTSNNKQKNFEDNVKKVFNTLKLHDQPNEKENHSSTGQEIQVHNKNTMPIVL